jgi:hypothetical protein
VSIDAVRYETTYRPERASRSGNRLTAIVAFVLGMLTAGIVFAAVQALGDRSASGSTGNGTAPASASAKPSAAAAVAKKQPASTWKPKSSAEVPPGPAVPVKGSGEWRVVPGTSAKVGTGPLRTYTVEIEKGVTLAEGDSAFAQAAQATLSDGRSWIGGGDVAWRRIDSGTPRLRIRLASQETARAQCGYEIPIDVSCHSGGVVYLSAVRWIRGAVAFKGDLASYRRYMVNHEVGHSIGRKHRPCTSNGGPAPVMMQQTFSTSNDEINDIIEGHPQGVDIPRDGKVCTANPWPFP